MRRPPRWDVVLALAIAVVSTASVVASAGTAACVVVSSLALAWRRTATLAAAVVFALGRGLPSVWSELSVQGPGLLAGSLIMSYSIGAHLPLRRALAGIGVFALGAVAHELRAGVGDDVAAAAFFWLLAATAWLVGRYVRRHREAAALARRSAELEREREETVKEAVSRERTRIARELHDIVSHSVSVMVVQAEAAEEILHAEPDRAAEPLRRIHGAGREALTEMRRMLGVLREDAEDGALAPRPTLDHLPEVVARVGTAGVRTELSVQGSPVHLAPGVDLAIYRVVQEALTNVLRHSGAARAHVRLRYLEETVEVEVTDDGTRRGPPAQGGQGIVGMRERVRLFGGEFDAGPRLEGGFRVSATFPVR